MLYIWCLFLTFYVTCFEWEILSVCINLTLSMSSKKTTSDTKLINSELHTNFVTIVEQMGQEI